MATGGAGQSVYSTEADDAVDGRVNNLCQPCDRRENKATLDLCQPYDRDNKATPVLCQPCDHRDTGHTPVYDMQ